MSSKVNHKTIHIYACSLCGGCGRLESEIEMNMFKTVDCIECDGTGLCESLRE